VYQRLAPWLQGAGLQADVSPSAADESGAQIFRCSCCLLSFAYTRLLPFKPFNHKSTIRNLKMPEA
jgi:hypothetical protein